jgi:hypothetical protein
MQSAHPELGDQAFGNVADALVTVEYESPEPEEPSQEATGARKEPQSETNSRASSYLNTVPGYDRQKEMKFYASASSRDWKAALSW